MLGTFPLFLYSGKCDYLNQYYPTAICESCENVWQVKAIKVFDILKLRDDFDVLVRFCPDAVIKNVDNLLIRIENGLIDRKIALGNKNQYKGIEYLRGGCNATSKLLVHEIVFHSNEKDYDIWYSKSLKQAGGILKNWPLFEINNGYTGKLPVWHPMQHKNIEIRFRIFKKEGKISYENCL